MDIKINAPSFKLIEFETYCYWKLLNLLIKQANSHIARHTYGCEDGLISFFALSLQLDCSVFLFEALKFYEYIVPEKVAIIKTHPEYSNLEVVRNNIHTYYKGGNFQKKANKIIVEKLKTYKMDKIDCLYPLRNDISLLFTIEDRTRRLIGSDYIIHHCIFESENKKWDGICFQNYAQYISETITGLVSRVDETVYVMPELVAEDHPPQIELFDFKSADAYSKLPVDSSDSFRLLLMLSQISYGIILVEQILNQSVVFSSNLWTCFLTKICAIKYDESFDNLQSLLNYASADDKVFLQKWLADNGINIEKLLARKFARKLRNTIHYQDILFNPDRCSNGSTAATIEAIYLSNSNIQSMQEFRAISKTLFDEAKQLQSAIQKVFALDKSYLF